MVTPKYKGKIRNFIWGAMLNYQILIIQEKLKVLCTHTHIYIYGQNFVNQYPKSNYVGNTFRVRLFWLKKVSGNHFTSLYVFGKHKKLGQMEIEFPVDCKISLIKCKTISAFILPSNYFQTWKIEEIEKEQEEIAPPPNPRSHWSHRTPTPARSRLLKIHTRRERELKHTPPKEPKNILAGQITVLVQTHRHR